MSARTDKLSRRQVRKVLGDGVPDLIAAHEGGLTAHGTLLNAVVLGPFWARLLWLLCGARVLLWLTSRRGATRA